MAMSMAPLLFLSLLSIALHPQPHEATETLPNNVTCIPSEREALLRFKKGLQDPSGWLSSWTGSDCCQWTAVTCDELTGHVTKLDLKSPDICVDEEEEESYKPQCLTGDLSPYLINLKHLSTLDLSNNNFRGIPIPTFLGSMKSLRYLDLSFSSFGGTVPSTLGNLSNLRYLDLSVDFYSDVDLRVSDLNWIPRLSSLNYLKLMEVNLKTASHHWSEKISTLSSLLELNLINCQLSNISDSLPKNFGSLSVINISQNSFNSTIPRWLFNISTVTELNLGSSGFTGPVPETEDYVLCNLRQLVLSFNKLTGGIGGLVSGLSGCRNKSLEKLDLTQNLFTGSLPDSLRHLTYLRILRLNQNSFSGSMPTSLGYLSRLEELDLSWNKLSGTIPQTVGQLEELTMITLLGNSWEGTVTEGHFRNLRKLVNLAVLSNYGPGSMKFVMSPNWVPGFDLKTIQVTNVQMGPAFPEWLKTQKNLSTVVLSRAGISDLIPDWLWALAPQIETLDLRGNQLKGKLPSTLLTFPEEASVNLGSNLLEGRFPLWSGLYKLSLRSNLLSGPLPSAIGQYNPRLRYLDGANNSLIGPVPPPIRSLAYLDLSQNSLSGTVFSNWTAMPELKVLDLSRNNLSGEIPSSLCSNLPSLEWLKLSGNMISGKLSSSTLNCTRLYTVDLGENKLQGSVPEFPDFGALSELLLRSNNFTGHVPDQLCSFPNLHIIDISDNDLSGPVPRCIGDMEGLKSYGTYYQLPLEFRSFYSGGIELNLKDRRMAYKYSELIPLLNLIDLSGNDLSGEIPEGITDLSFLGTLNLSRNQLSGKIPENTFLLKKIETLDLSQNRLSGQIPPSMASMTFLTHLNVSYNKLSGQIPSQNQFQTFGESSFEGNLGLCGPPLSTNCSTQVDPGDGEAELNKGGGEDKEDKLEELWFYMCTAVGFVLGFWSVCGSLAVKTSWRHAYFRFVDRIKDRIYVFVAVNVRARFCKEEERTGNQPVPNFVLHPSQPSVRQ